MKEKKKGNIIGILIVMAIIIFGVIYGGITLTKNWGKSKETISKENATGKLKKICKDININEVEPRKDVFGPQLEGVKKDQVATICECQLILAELDVSVDCPVIVVKLRVLDHLIDAVHMKRDLFTYWDLTRENLFSEHSVIHGYRGIR